MLCISIGTIINYWNIYPNEYNVLKNKQHIHKPASITSQFEPSALIQLEVSNSSNYLILVINRLLIPATTIGNDVFISLLTALVLL